MHVLLKAGIWFLVFLIGASLGSFYQAVGDRVLLYFYGPMRKRPAAERWREFFFRRSFCFGCGRPLRPLELLPVLGWFIARGRCSACGASVSLLHPMIELAFGVLAILFLEVTGHWFATLLLLLICGHLLIAMVTDFHHLSLDYENTAILAILSVVLVWLLHGIEVLQISALTAAGVSVFFVASLIVSRGKQPGFGDVLLGGALGLLHGFPWILFPLQIGAAGTLLHIWVMRGTRHTPAPLGFYMALGSVITLVVTLLFRG